ncbi:hypothetical protein PHAVU_001G161800 [Phaseolus vulgaris]|uniref:RRM domain-containing protein n=1 Tax=Phaseolus vulgaris TaxID=3885 RepID=V7CWI2_PHAVU|nr:hypothetical protein PHAVU_001G161800g [Phaseolus vulgaris]ESW34547.1 hypothetical protein PHAVU_001G161800g [Phaseolus vulgaris]
MNQEGTSFFFSNFPFDLKESDLWKIFRRWGRVSDVFISHRLNIKKQRFGFVRFQGVQNIRELEYHLNTIWIGSWKLSVNRPKCSRAADTRKEWNVKLKEKAIESEKYVKKEWRSKGLSTYANIVRYGHRDRAQTQNRDNLHAIHFRAEETPRDWLNKCYIGRVSDLNKVSSLNESFILGGLGYIKVKFLGGFHVLLKGENELKIKDAIEENKAWFEEMFDTIIPWEEQFVAVDKLVWVRCRGLPLKLWNTDCFKHIAALLGTLIEVDEATMALEELEYARFKIRVSVGCEAKITSYMKINEVLYQVSVEEECTIPDYKLCQCHWSEESVSMETEVDSIASNASVRSGSRDFEYGRKVVEENLLAKICEEQPPSTQGHRRSAPIVSSGCGDPLLGRPIEMAQEGETRASYVVEEGGCRGKNLNEATWLSGPVVHGEEQLCFGPRGSLTISENSQDLNETEQGGQLGEDKASPHHETFRNEVITAFPPRSLGATEESRRNLLCTKRVEVKEAVGSTVQASTMEEENKGGNLDSSKSVSRVEDSLGESQEVEAYQFSNQQALVVTKNKHKLRQTQMDSKSSRIKDTYFPFGKQRNKGTQLIVDAGDNQRKQVNNSITTNSSATMERRVFWVGESSKSSKREERKNIRRMRNEIKGVNCNLSGNWVEEPNKVKEMVLDFYKKKMSATEDIGVRLDNVVFKEISESENRFLTDPFDDKEIKEAIWNCDSQKSPGPDGVTFSFIKNNWSFLEKDMLGVVKFFHKERTIPKGCNASFITMIPK